MDETVEEETKKTKTRKATPKKKTSTEAKSASKAGRLEALMKLMKEKHKESSINIPVLTEKLDVISSGSIKLDRILGVGGFPRGQVVEFFGYPAAGKTTVCLNTIKEAQKKDLICAIIDLERAFSPNYAARIGIDPSSIVHLKPKTGEEAMENAITLAESGNVDVIMVDSIATVLPEKEKEVSLSSNGIALGAQLITKALRQLVPAAADNNCLVLLVNQVRVSIGSPGMSTPGGLALKHAVSMRIQLTSGGKPTLQDGVTVATRVKATVKKSRHDLPGKSTDFMLFKGRGVSTESDLLDLGTEFGFVSKSGNWFKYGDVSLGNGLTDSIETLEDNLEIKEELLKKVLAELEK